MARSIEERLAEVEDRLAIRELVARYAFAIDDRDLQTVGELFTADGAFGSADGVMRATGRQAVVEQFKLRYSVLGPTNHISHDHVIDFESATRARGKLSSHAEVWRLEQAQLAALRYDDTYEKGADGKWRFAERRLSFMYYVPVEKYAESLGKLERNLAYPEPRAADYPERTATYVEYRKGK